MASDVPLMYSIVAVVIGVELAFVSVVSGAPNDGFLPNAFLAYLECF